MREPKPKKIAPAKRATPPPRVRVPSVYTFELPSIREGIERAALTGIPEVEFAAMCSMSLDWIEDSYRSMHRLPVQQPECVTRRVTDLLTQLDWTFKLRLPTRRMEDER